MMKVSSPSSVAKIMKKDEVSPRETKDFQNLPRYNL